MLVRLHFFAYNLLTHKQGGGDMGGNAQIHNVVRLDHKNEVYKAIVSFLEKKEMKSKNTKDAYERDIRQFFKYMRGKDIEELLEEDLKFKNADMVHYQSYLYKTLKYSNTTINRKINTILALYSYLESQEFDVKPEVLKVEELAEDSKPIGSLELDEVYLMLSILGDSRREKEMKAFILISLQTSLRKDAVLNLNVSQIMKTKENEVMIMAYDKGKQHFKEIDQETYDLLMELKLEDGKFFTIPKRTLDYNFKSLCKKIGIDPLRRVSIHSLKKAGVDYVKEATGDLQAAQEQAGHSSPTTTAKYYVKRPKNLLPKLLQVREYKNIFRELTHEECIQLLESFTNGIEYQLKLKAKEIIDARKEKENK